MSKTSTALHHRVPSEEPQDNVEEQQHAIDGNLANELDKCMEFTEMWCPEKNPFTDDTLKEQIKHQTAWDRRNQTIRNYEADDDLEAGRETWGKKVDFLLSVIGFAVDLSNVWRFPNLCYANGGGAFLIPYLLMMAVGGIPLFYMELALGQYNRRGAITCWGRICPLFKGVGMAVVMIAFYVDFFYNVILAWCLYLFFDSFADELPWMHCNNSWNTPHCSEGTFHRVSLQFVNVSDNGTNSTEPRTYLTVALRTEPVSKDNHTAHERRVSPTQEYFERGMLGMHHSQGIDDLGGLRWELLLSLMTIYLICYFSLWKGISGSGKVVWFTSLFPYFVLFIMLIRGFTLPGAMDGVRYYIMPDVQKLKVAEVWVAAAGQVFFSLGPGFGVILAFASYNKFNNNVYWDCIATSFINFATSFLSGLVIFAVLGYMSHKTGEPIDQVAQDGPALVFHVYPEALATLPGSNVWSALFFMMLLTLGLDSSFGGSEAIITAISDEFPKFRRRREYFVGVFFAVLFGVGVFCCTQGGSYLVHLMDNYAAVYSILIAVFFESVAVSWFYGVDRFCADIKEMLGYTPGIYWRVCWKFVAPIFLAFNIGFGLYNWKPLHWGEYKYPDWANVAGWIMAGSSVACIPGVACYKLMHAKGSLCQRWRHVTRPWKERSQEEEQQRQAENEQRRLEEERHIAMIAANPFLPYLSGAMPNAT